MGRTRGTVGSPCRNKTSVGFTQRLWRCHDPPLRTVRGPMPVEDRAKEVQRGPKFLEDARIKLESAVTDVMGKTSRRNLAP